MDWLRVIHGEQPSTPLTFGTGDELRVWYRITEQGKERLGQFEGICIRSRGCGVSRSFTVRRITYGEGVERTFPVDAKIISRIEVLRKGKVHRARLYFLRRAIG
ncbi:MAG: 50S ribosomal protein L19, partial [Candidatus Omnitrophica bacterium]|nr:50S ribosomal protein L19 [Candidatus Omnitrophota bacterium]